MKYNKVIIIIKYSELLIRALIISQTINVL